MNVHERFMRRAYALACKAKGKTSPNPMVGAVVVKNGVVVGQGYHKKAGDSHAEVVALNAAKEKARGASLYVTLEPCVHFGRTPPCVNRIIKSGIKHVYIGMVDPNPLTNGKGIQTLRDHGISVNVGFCEAELIALNEVFITYITKHRPFITVKVAQSLDGKIATESGDSRWVTSDRSRAFSHRIRSQYDAIMVGINTVLRDNPRLDSWFSKKHPIKIIVDSQLSTPQNAVLFEHGRPCIVVTIPTRPGQETENRAILAQKAKILEVKEKAGQVNLKDMMRKLAGLEITSILVEGGGTLIGSLFDEGLVDRVMFFVSPKIIGGKNAISSVMGAGAPRVDRAVGLKNVTMKRMGSDFLFEGYV
ncbi:MAG TPA: bifunctional diaminohydroxyphosphoribosylaminopyrimidine deaminase/5-amino-6-(5-phosphoribosylamino)uracil reductase RibD [Candidatus Omnitrophota bacterium]|nr:bifunctional diaminohydroxyphosphoribosylaminopyrimidine deaminase/5-amino-6-(5-phosphoribosylamino)uracil reductase RibD [Candidatus Omnitrophota bacterium]